MNQQGRPQKITFTFASVASDLNRRSEGDSSVVTATVSILME